MIKVKNALYFSILLISKGGERNPGGALMKHLIIQKGSRSYLLPQLRGGGVPILNVMHGLL